MEDKIEALYEYIMERKRLYLRRRKLLGDREYVENMLREIYGMEVAFEIIAGHSFTQHLIDKCDETLKRTCV
jgi:Zn-finger domain-containing protein